LSTAFLEICQQIKRCTYQSSYRDSSAFGLEIHICLFQHDLAIFDQVLIPIATNKVVHKNWKKLSRSNLLELQKIYSKHIICVGKEKELKRIHH